MTERDTKQLYKLLGKFLEAQDRQDQVFLSDGERQVVVTVRGWVKWYADDELGGVGL